LRHLSDRNSLGYIAVDLSYCEHVWLRGITKEGYALGSLRNEFTDTSWIVTTEKDSSEVNIKRTTIGFKNFK